MVYLQHVGYIMGWHLSSTHIMGYTPVTISYFNILIGTTPKTNLLLNLCTKDHKCILYVYCIVGFSRYLNSTNLSISVEDIDRFVKFKPSNKK